MSERPAPGGRERGRGPAHPEGPLPEGLLDPDPSRLDPGHPLRDEILRRHRAAIEAGERLYEDPSSGLWVMTADALWRRSCCENGCRHCPHLERG